MRVTISIQTIDAPQLNLDKDFVSEDFPAEMKIADLKEFIENETRVPSAAQRLFYNGTELHDGSKTLQQCQIAEDSMLGLQVRNPQTTSPMTSRPIQGQAIRPRPASAEQPGQAHDPEILRLQALGNPAVLENIRQQQPGLADTVQDPARFRRAWEDIKRQHDEHEAEKARKLELLSADPLNVEAQREIEEMIRLEAVVENLHTAMEHNPEAFGHVNMLYIPVEVNGHKVKAFVDSGAQRTIVSPGCAERCGLLRLADKRFSGIAMGVGTAKVLGRVHSAMIKIGTLYLACSFTIVEGKDVDLLLGLDMLKKHQTRIDLEKNKLIIQGTEVEFLGEADIPKRSEVYKEELNVEDPAGSRIGATSGAITESGDGTSTNPPAAAQPSLSERQSAKGTVQQHQSTTQAGHSASGRAQGTQSIISQSQFPKEDIEQLMGMGYGHDEVVQALEMAGGNVEMAAGLLL